MQRPERAQRVHVTVEQQKLPPGHLGANMRQHFRDLRMVENLHAIIGGAGLVVQPLLEQLPPLLEFVVAERQMEAAVALETDVESGLVKQLV